MLKSLLSAFLMYSRIPVPQVEWTEENRRYALGFFPLIGTVIGSLLIAWRLLCNVFDIGQFLFAAVAVFIPVVVTGGIHLDGFCDVVDERSSFADKEKRLEIMSDPHVGSFACMYLCIYLILYTALLSQVNSLKGTAIIAFGNVLSRSLSGISAITFKSAKSEGTLQSFVKPSHKKITLIMDIFFMLVSSFAMAILSPVQGISCVCAATVVFIYYRYSAYKNFGGTTGDLCGWFLQLCEICITAAVVFSERISEVIK